MLSDNSSPTTGSTGLQWALPLQPISPSVSSKNKIMNWHNTIFRIIVILPQIVLALNFKKYHDNRKKGSQIQNTDYSEARDLFFRYEGNLIAMSQGWDDKRYKKYKVPADVEEKWRKELYVRNLTRLYNDDVVAILLDLSTKDSLHDILKSEPKGTFTKKCAFLEALMKYGKSTKFNEGHQLEIKSYVDQWASKLSNDISSDFENDILQSIINSVKSYS